ncbi:MAG: hypothetical protein AAFY47_13085 [Pseudomonadota bacterium]
MNRGGLANTRNALIFAGGVIACSVLLAMSMGSQFTPTYETEGSASEEAEPATTASASRAQASAPRAQQTGPSANEFFGDFDGFAEDQALIDDTKGFDPKPVDDPSVIIESEPNRAASAPEGSQVTTRRSSTRSSPGQEGEDEVRRTKPAQPQDDIDWKTPGG